MRAPAHKCPQCGSEGCGVWACRFSGVPNAMWKTWQTLNAGADKTKNSEDTRARDDDMTCWGTPLHPGQ